MSRTIRRKNGYNRFTNQYMYDYVEFVSVYGGIYREHVYYTGHEKRKGLAKYHSDSYVDDRYCNIYPHSSRQIQHQIDRARTRDELARYRKDNEYEVMIRKNPHFNYWQ